MTTTLGSIDMPLDQSRPAEGGRLGSIPASPHLSGMSYSDVVAVAMQNARVEAGLVGDDLDEKKGMDAFSRSSMLAREWIGGGGGGTAWNEMNLGYSLSGNVVTVTAGALWFGTLDRIAIATADITISVDQTWIYVEHVFGSGTAALASGTTAPVDDVTTLRWPLSLWGYADSTATIAQLCHVGDIVVKTVRGA